ncbi:MAG: hypothetical protein JRN35_08235 [Nitrososphaerota archaeon]|nr:hypothetical protein [Nitrososphaerota archaeon]
MPRYITSVIALFVMIALTLASNGALAQGSSSSAQQQEPPGQGSNSGHIGCAGDHWGYGEHKGKTSTSNNSSIPVGITLTCLLDVLGLDTNSAPEVTTTIVNGTSFRVLVESFQSNNSNFSGTLTLSANQSLQPSELATVNQTQEEVNYTTYVLELKDSDFENDTSEQVMASVSNIETDTIYSSSTSTFVIICCGGGGGGGGGGSSSSTYVSGLVVNQYGEVVPNAQVSIEAYTCYVQGLSWCYSYYCTEANAYGQISYMLPIASNSLQPLAGYLGVTYTLMISVYPLTGGCAGRSISDLPMWSVNYYVNSNDYTSNVIQAASPESAWVDGGVTWYDYADPTSSGLGQVGTVQGTTDMVEVSTGGTYSVSSSATVSASTFTATSADQTYETDVGTYVPCADFSSIGGVSGSCGVEFQYQASFVGVLTVYSENGAGLKVINQVGVLSSATLVTRAVPLLTGDPYNPSDKPLGYSYQQTTVYPHGSADFTASDLTTTASGWQFGGGPGGSVDIYGATVSLTFYSLYSQSVSQTNGVYFHTHMYNPTSNSCLEFEIFQEEDYVGGTLVNGPVHAWVTGTELWDSVTGDCVTSGGLA